MRGIEMEYSFADNLIAFSTERHCSDAGAPYDGFNITHYSGDAPDHVLACRQQLCRRLGIPAHAIHVSGICTYTHYSRFFSARRLGIHSGRIFTGIMQNMQGACTPCTTTDYQ